MENGVKAAETAQLNIVLRNLVFWKLLVIEMPPDCRAT